MKRIAFVITLAIILSISGKAYANSPTYQIDSIYDDKNGTWNSSQTPTLVGGEDYTFSINGRGYKGFSGAWPDGMVNGALFIDWDRQVQTIDDWNSPSHNGFQDIVTWGVSFGNGTFYNGITYSITQTFTVPLNVSTGDTLAFVGFEHGAGNWGYVTESTLYTNGQSNTTGAYRTQMVHLQSPVPEPATMTLLGLGLLGGLGRRIFRRKL